MNAFVRDGAVNRRRRSRHSLNARNIEPARKKKQQKTNDDRAATAPRDLVASTLRSHTGESTVNQSTVIATEKESRYSNADFMRARSFLYFDFKKISSVNVNKDLKEYLKKFDENETQLKKIFEKCYDLTGSVEKSKAMMKQLETNVYVRLDLPANSFSEVTNRLSTELCKVVGKSDKMENKKSKDLRLKQKIDEKNIKLFGKIYSKKDKKILYTNSNTTFKINEHFEDTLSDFSSDSEIDESIRITKFYSLNTSQNNSLSDPKTDDIILCTNNSQSNQSYYVKRSISATDEFKGLYTPVQKMIKKALCVKDTVNSQIAASNMNSFEEMINPQLITDANDKSPIYSSPKTNVEEVEITVPQLKIDGNIEKRNQSYVKRSISATDEFKGLCTPVQKMIKKALCVKDTVNSQIAASNMNSFEEMINPQLITDANDKSPIYSSPKTNVEEVEITVPQLKIDGNIEKRNQSYVKRSISATDEFKGLCTPVQKMIKKALCVKDTVNSQIAASNMNSFEEMINPQLITDANDKSPIYSSPKTNVEEVEITVPQLKIDGNIEKRIDAGENTFSVYKPKLDATVQSAKVSVLKTNIDEECINLGLKKCTSIQDLVDTTSNVLMKTDTNIDDSKNKSKELNYANIELEIRKIINTDDDVFKNSIVKDLATYFLNQNFLYKVDDLWKTAESDLVGDLIIKLLNMFNDCQYNMAQLSGCLICIFREIAERSPIPPSQTKLKLIVFLDAIKKYIKFHDNGLWRTWFLPSMFIDWCFVITCIFMNTKNDFSIELNKQSVLRNATAYYRKVKRSKYLFINQDFKPNKSLKKNGIFELTRIDDLLEIDEHLPNSSINVLSNEPKRKELNTDDKSMDTINYTTPSNIEEVCPTPVYPKIFVHPQFNFSNSFINKLKWFNNFSKSTNMKDINSSSIVIQNNSTVGNNAEPPVVGNNTEPPVVGNNREPPVVGNNTEPPVVGNNTEPPVVGNNTEPPVVGNNTEPPVVGNNTEPPVVCNNTEPPVVKKRPSVTTKPTKRKKSNTQDVSPRVFFTIDNNPKEFDITYSASAVPQYLSSSVAPRNLSLSAAAPQNLSPYYNNISTNSTQLPVSSQTVFPRNLNSHYNNITASNYSQVPNDFQTLPSITKPTQISKSKGTNPPVDMNLLLPIATRPSVISNKWPSITETSQTSNVRYTNPPVDINSSSSVASLPQVSSNTWSSIHNQHLSAMNAQPLKPAKTWPSNIYTDMCNVSSCSTSVTCYTQNTNYNQSCFQSLYNYNIPSATSHPQYSNVPLTYPTNYTQPISNDQLASTTSMVRSMNAYMQQTNGTNNFSYRNHYSSQNNLPTPDHNTQVSPDLPDARLPNMPNHQGSDILNKTCMAANCTNTSCFSCTRCKTAFYCSTPCQKSDWHYHQNECRK